MKLAIAQTYADEIVQAVALLCEAHPLGGTNCLITGSIRRQRPEVHDIELVALPTWKTPFWVALNRLGWWPKNKVAAASRYVRLTRSTPHGSLLLDVFLPQKFDWGRQVAIRTGPADYSNRLARAWVKKGYHGTEFGLLPEGDCIMQKAGWTLRPNLQPNPVQFDTEAAFFAWLGVAMLEPSKRF